jgi:hypothetical protein
VGLVRAHHLTLQGGAGGLYRNRHGLDAQVGALRHGIRHLGQQIARLERDGGLQGAQKAGALQLEDGDAGAGAQFEGLVVAQGQSRPGVVTEGDGVARLHGGRLAGRQRRVRAGVGAFDGGRAAQHQQRGAARRDAALLLHPMGHAPDADQGEHHQDAMTERHPERLADLDE